MGSGKNFALFKTLDGKATRKRVKNPFYNLAVLSILQTQLRGLTRAGKLMKIKNLYFLKRQKKLDDFKS